MRLRCRAARRADSIKCPADRHRESRAARPHPFSRAITNILSTRRQSLYTCGSSEGFHLHRDSQSFRSDAASAGGLMSDKDTYLVLGGGGMIGAQVVHEIASQLKPRWIVLCSR